MIISYKGLKVKVDKERPIKCECCQKIPFRTQCHHYKYEFTKKQVKENPELVLKNTQFLCYSCHLLANALRKIAENQEKCKKLGLVKFEMNLDKPYKSG